jgi:hypothetical protein
VDFAVTKAVLTVAKGVLTTVTAPEHVKVGNGKGWQQAVPQI